MKVEIGVIFIMNFSILFSFAIIESTQSTKLTKAFDVAFEKEGNERKKHASDQVQ